MSESTNTTITENNEQKLTRVKSNQRGMTLIEIMIVIVIFGLVMGAITFGIMPRFKKAKRKTTRMKLDNIASILIENADEEEYQGKDGKALLDALIQDGMIKKKDIKDAWGQEIRVEKGDDGFCVISAGPDKNFGSKDDIRNSDCKE